MATGKIFQIAFMINAALQGGFLGTMGAASGAMREMAERTSRIKAAQNQLNTQWKESQAAINRHGERLGWLTREYEKGNISKAKYRAEVARVSQAARNAGMSIEAYRGHLGRLSGELRQVEAQQQRLRTAMSAKLTASANLASAQAAFVTSVGITEAALSPLAGAVKTAMDFEATMSKVRAIANATPEEYARLSAKAEELGASTRFTAQQSAEAMTYLAMAGWKEKEIIGGMRPMLDLAAAGGTDLARTADILSDDLTAFGLTADDARHMADVFAYTISNSNTTVEMMGESMKYAAPVAKAYGATMEETAAMIGIMANAGIKASQAGTSLRAGFLRLAGPPKKASKELEALGINLSDAQREMEETQATLSAYGIKLDENMPPQQKMVSVIRQLSENTQGLSDEQRLAALSAIFGTNAASGWLNVINQGPKKLEEFINALNNCDGEAKRMSDTMMDNAEGAMIEFQSAVEGAGIKIGKQFLPAVQGILKEGTGLARSLADWASKHETLVQYAGLAAAALGGTAVAATGVAVAVAGAGWVAAQIEILSNSTMIAWAKMKLVRGATIAWQGAQWLLNAALAANPIGLFIAGVAAAIAIGYVLYKNWDKVKAYMAKIWDSPAAAVIAFITGPIGWIMYAAAGLISHWDEVKAWFTLLWNDPGAALKVFVDMVKNKFSDMYQYIAEKWSKLKYILSNPITAAVNYVEHGNVYGSMIHQSTGMSADEIRGIGTDALGGIYNRPRLTWVAEAGYPEAIVPLDGSSRGVALWQQAGQMLGMLPKESEEGQGGGLWKKAGEILGIGSTDSAGGISSKSAAQNFAAPPISINLTFNGPTDAQEVQTAVERAAQTAQRSFADQMAELMREKERLSYA